MKGTCKKFPEWKCPLVWHKKDDWYTLVPATMSFASMKEEQLIDISSKLIAAVQTWDDSNGQRLKNFLDVQKWLVNEPFCNHFACFATSVSAPPLLARSETNACLTVRFPETQKTKTVIVSHELWKSINTGARRQAPAFLNNYAK